MPVTHPLTMLPALALNHPVALIEPYIPDQVLAIHKGRQITQAEFLQELQQVAAHLPDAGFVFNLCEDRYHFLLGFCAILLRGAVNLLPPNRQPVTLAELAQDYPGCYCLVDQAQDLHSQLPSTNIVAILAGITPAAAGPVPTIPAQQLAAVAFTSGSTGKSRPNAKCFGTLAATARLLGARFSHNLPTPRLVGTVPPQHMYGLETTLFMVLQAGCAMYSGKPFYPADVQQLLLHIAEPVILVTTPIHLRALVSAGLDMPGLAGIISATAPLDPVLATAAEHCFQAPLWEIYGCTEAGSMATRRPTQTTHWQLLDGFHLEVDDEGALARAPHLPDAAPIQDQLSLVANDTFLLCGRNADMINVAGKRASLAHLTLQLLQVEGVTDGVIFLPPHTGHAELRPVALVVSDLPEKHILAALALRLDAALLPRPLRKVAALPRNETGKLTAAALHHLWEQTHARP